MDNYSAEAQKFLNAGKAYETWVECVALYAGGETLAAVKKSQNYIKDVEKIMQHEKWASIVKRYGALSDAIICFFYTHIAVWASRVYRLDDEGNETNIGDAIMEEAMKMFTKLENFMQSDDHVLHLKLSLFSSKIKLLNLNMNKNQDDIDNLFREARAWSQKCGKTRECMHFKALIDVLDVILSFRSNKIGYADSKALEIWDSFSEEKLLNDKGISLELAILCLFHIEKSRLVEYSDEIQITYRQKCKMYLRNVFGRKLTKMHCRLFQSLAAISLHFEHNYVIRCFPLARQHSKASRYLHKAQQGWKNLIKCSDINLKQSKWFVHSMFYSYHKYITTSKPKHLQNMKNLFDSMFEQIFASPEVGNLEILEIWMRVLGNTKNFKEIHRICCESKQIVSHKKLVYPFSIVMELLENICLLKTSALDSNFKDNSLKSLFGVLCRMQRCADHPKLSFWHSYGNKCYSEVLLQIGDFDSLEKIHERSPNISYQLPGNYSQFCTQRSQDSLSSWTTISEVMEVNFAEVVFDFFITTDLQCITMNHSLEDVNQTSTSLKSVEQELAQSFDTLKSILIGDYQVHEDNIQIFGSKNCNQALLKERDARVLIVVQVKDEREQLQTVEDYKLQLKNSGAKFTWLIIQTILVCEVDDPDYRQKYKAKLSGEDFLTEDAEMIVTRCIQKIDWSNFVSHRFRKYLPDSLSQTLREEKKKMVKKEIDSSSIPGASTLSIHDLYTRMKAECSLNKDDYLSADVVSETLTTKEICIVLG